MNRKQKINFINATIKGQPTLKSKTFGVFIGKPNLFTIDDKQVSEFIFQESLKLVLNEPIRISVKIVD
jgi:hypothetical protein